MAAIPVPRVLHQLWKDRAIPARYASFRESWRRHNPGWELRLWTDRDLAALVDAGYPRLASVFAGYKHPISRADLGRYLVLNRFGGVYADLDCECLRPIDPLLAGARFLIGVEPPSHLEEDRIAAAGLSQLFCPSFIASEPGHPAWRAVFKHIAKARAADDPLEATGPYLLTRALAGLAVKGQITAVAPSVLYPFDKLDCWNGRIHDIEVWEAATREAYVFHAWDGGWHRAPEAMSGLPLQATARLAGDGPGAAEALFQVPAPLISCLLESGGDARRVRRAIDQFLAQTWTHKELVVATSDPAVAELAARFDPAVVRLIRAPSDAGASERLALAAREARGPIHCVWSQDDLHDPARIEVQYRVLAQTRAERCGLGRWLDWDPSAQSLTVVEAPLRSSAMRLRARRRGDEAGPRSVMLDLSRLCVRVRRAGEEAPGPTAATYSGERYDAVLAELSKRLPVASVQRGPKRAKPPADAAAQPEIRLFGHFSAAIGVGGAARGTAKALAAAAMPFTPFDLLLSETHPSPTPGPLVDPACSATADVRIDLIHTNPDLLQAARAQGALDFGPADGERVRRVGLWVWETETGIPANWRAASLPFDEIWAPSAYAAAAIRSVAPSHVSLAVMPEVVAPDEPTLSRAQLGLPADHLIFLCAFDATSNVARKNPAGLIRAFRAAFPTPRDDVLLVIKAKKLSAEDVAALSAVTLGRANIRLINEPWDEARYLALVRACDAYVSLHRAEGFGRSMAEAMYFAKPVIATAYSGNLDFMSDETAYLVPAQPTRLAADDGGYAAGSVWGEPDLDAAARLMAKVERDRSAAAAVGQRARAWVQTHLSAEASGARIRDRLADLARRPWAEAPAQDAPKHRARPSDPSVLVLTPIKNGAAHLARYLQLVQRLDHDPQRLSLAFLESDSDDGTFAALRDAACSFHGRFAGFGVHRVDFNFHPQGPRWAPALQRARRSILARSRNRLLQAALGDHDWVLWLDVDLTDYPADLLARLIAAERDIVAPHCVRRDGTTFDLNTFRFAAPCGDDARHLVDGVFQPPVGEGRLYLDAFRDRSLVPVDSVGGAALLVRGDLHRDGLNFPAFPYRGYLETEGLAMMAKDMGRETWAMPRLHVIHADG